MEHLDDDPLAAGGELCQFLLTRPEAIKRLVDALEVSPSDEVLEVGGGRGTVTRGLLVRAPRNLVTVELDQRLAAALAREFAAEPSVRVLCGDGLEAIAHTNADLLLSNLPIALTPQTLELVFSSKTLRRCVMVADRTASAIGCPPGWVANDVCDLTGDDFTPAQPVVSHVLRLVREP